MHLGLHALYLLSDRSIMIAVIRFDTLLRRASNLLHEQSKFFSTKRAFLGRVQSPFQLRLSFASQYSSAHGVFLIFQPSELPIDKFVEPLLCIKQDYPKPLVATMHG